MNFLYIDGKWQIINREDYNKEYYWNAFDPSI